MAEAVDEFEQLFNQCYQPVCAYARRRALNRVDADDIVSEVFSVAWRRRHELDSQRNPLPWLYAIAANVLRNHFRSGTRRTRLEQKIGAQLGARWAPDPSEQSEQIDQGLLDALATMSFDDQEVLRLKAWEGLSNPEIAEVLQCSPRAVAVRVHRARQRLRKALDQSESTVSGQPEEGSTHG